MGRKCSCFEKGLSNCTFWCMWKNTFQNKCLISIIVLWKHCHKAFAFTLINSWLIYCFNAVKSPAVWQHIHIFFLLFFWHGSFSCCRFVSFVLNTQHVSQVPTAAAFVVATKTQIGSGNTTTLRGVFVCFCREPCRPTWALQMSSAVCRHRRPPVSATAPHRSLITSRSAKPREEKIGASKTRGRLWPSQWMCMLTSAR